MTMNRQASLKQMNIYHPIPRLLLLVLENICTASFNTRATHDSSASLFHQTSYNSLTHFWLWYNGHIRVLRLHLDYFRYSWHFRHDQLFFDSLNRTTNSGPPFFLIVEYLTAGHNAIVKTHFNHVCSISIHQPAPIRCFSTAVKK